MVCGDFSTKLGNAFDRFSCHSDTNINGEKLRGFVPKHNLQARNIKFFNKAKCLWTFQYPNVNKAQVDYIVVKMKEINCVSNLQTISFLWKYLVRPYNFFSKYNIRFDVHKRKLRNIWGSLASPWRTHPPSPPSADTLNCDVELHTKYGLTRTCIKEVALEFLCKNKHDSRVSPSSQHSVKKSPWRPPKNQLTAISKRNVVNARDRF